MKRTTNTGKLALEALTNSEMIVRGLGAIDLTKSLLADYTPLLFFPSEDAAELTSEFVWSLGTKPIQLLVPDGNWRQASKVHSRHPELAEVRRVKISTANRAEKHLRVEHMPEGMSTLEAIARALGVIESREIEKQLLALYSEKLNRTLLARGQSVETIDS